jgi:hypothetical protein
MAATPLDVARSYIARGWNPVPVRHRTKKPIGDEWQLRIINDANVAAHFNATPQNIGVILGTSSHGLTDVDLDCVEAVALAPVILPKTDAMFGRASARAAHWLYRTGLVGKVEGATLQFHDPRRRHQPKSMLVELRVGGGKGAQTVFPGSTHKETGELIEWDSDGEPAVANDADLPRLVRRVAALSLLVRYWPGEGGRHRVGLVVGGFLARAGIPVPMVKYLVEAIARAAGDDEVADRRKAADDAAREHAAGRKAAGLPRMAEFFGQDITDAVAEWLDYPTGILEDTDSVTIEAPIEEEETEPLGAWDAGEDSFDSFIDPRPWLLGNTFCCGVVSSLLGEGGAGKSATRMVQYVSIASCRKITHEHVFFRTKVLLLSLEDNQKEVRRRLRACLLHHDLDYSDIKGHLFIKAIDKNLGKLLTMNPKTGELVRGKLADKIKAFVVAHGIKLVALDPFIKSHRVGENDNNAIDAVVTILSEMADELDIAIDVPHHVRKGGAEAGNADAGRGAGSMKDACRLVYTLTAMSKDEAANLSVSEEDRRLLRRVDSAKVNLARPTIDADWFKLVGVPLGNKTERYPSGDHVQTVEVWTPPALFSDLPVTVIWKILDQIEAGFPDGQRYSNAPNAKTLAVWKVISEHVPAKSDAACRKVIAQWLDSGLLFPESYDNPVTRKTAQGLRVDQSKRPQ